MTYQVTWRDRLAYRVVNVVSRIATKEYRALLRLGYMQVFRDVEDEINAEKQSVYLCYGDADECIGCGGSASLGGTQEIVRDESGNPFCGVDCRDEHIAFLAEEKRIREKRLADERADNERAWEERHDAPNE